ncbi:mRNA (guanine-N7-)-methyltransferase [Aureococcus anophagefferens]|nr:mRNA (guanine-N7-)-methyltransferase [Aureococcus anophagefferens]
MSASCEAAAQHLGGGGPGSPSVLAVAALRARSVAHKQQRVDNGVARRAIPFDATSYVAWARTLDIVVHDSFGLTAGDSDARAVVAACDVDASPERPAELVFVPFDAMLHARSPLVCSGERANAAPALLGKVSSDFSEIVDKSRAAVEESDPGKQLSAAVKASLRFPGWISKGLAGRCR